MHVSRNVILLQSSDRLVLLVLGLQGCTATIIACSGNCLADDERVYKSAGADLVWPKPFPSAKEMRDDLLNCSSLNG